MPAHLSSLESLLFVFCAVMGALVILFIVLRPKKAAVSVDEDLVAFEQGLSVEEWATPSIVIHKARLLENAQHVKRALGASGHHIRLVTKSLPSPELLATLSEALQTRRFMEFHAPFLPELFKALGPAPLDVLFGKPVPTASVAQVFAQATPELKARLATEVTWLVDSKERAQELNSLAKLVKEQTQVERLKVALEINVGMHREGIKTPQELAQLLVELLSELANAGSHLILQGLMGYDGHVGFAPAFLAWGSKRRAICGAFNSSVKSYDEYIAVWKAAAAGALPSYGSSQPNYSGARFAPHPIFNSGGSRTYSLYKNMNPTQSVNDVALGSAFLMPSDFDDTITTGVAQGHKPALFIAAPVLKRVEYPAIPFLPPVAAKLWALWDKNLALGVFIYGGWGLDAHSPRGLKQSPLYAHTPNRNLLPNQDLLLGPKAVAKLVKNRVYFRPPQGDNFYKFQYIQVVGPKMECWSPINRRF